ncbi:MAG: AAA family ATPase [Caulobacteraceae bacterium]|nr:AAA family ATPase [Caulobacteraceae bacterium]
MIDATTRPDEGAIGVSGSAHLAEEAGQAFIVEALADGSALGSGQPLKRIDTHMSRLFLGRDRVFKLLRSRRHPFADMSSIEARRQACEAELAVNAIMAGDLYERVSPVIRDADGAIRIQGEVSGEGEILDWVVIMHRFADGALVEEIAEDGGLTPDLVTQIADVVASFHGALPPEALGGHAADYERIIQGLRRTEAQGAAALGLEADSEALFGGLERELTRAAPLIEVRRKAGWVRRGHGDLHLRNICLFKGKVTPFDALEFDPALATADVIYDMAFLFMDLRARGLNAYANLAMNRYWDASRQPEEALALLPLFTALRAAVRMAVAVEAGSLEEAARYRALGLELLKRAPGRLVAVGGLSGTGKSTLAQALAPDLPGPCGGRLLRSDVIRKALAGVEATTRLGGAAYEPASRASIYRELALKAREALGAGASVIADGTFREGHARDSIEGAAAGHPFTGLWLRALIDTRLARVSGRRNDASDATVQVALAQSEPGNLGAVWQVIDADPPAAVLAEALRPLMRGPAPRT